MLASACSTILFLSLCLSLSSHLAQGSKGNTASIVRSSNTARVHVGIRLQDKKQKQGQKTKRTEKKGQKDKNKKTPDEEVPFQNA
jgi:hypothetical protein